MAFWRFKAWRVGRSPETRPLGILLHVRLCFFSCGKDAGNMSSSVTRREASGNPGTVEVVVRPLAKELANAHPGADSSSKKILENIPTVAGCSGKDLLPARLWRLSETQYLNTISDVFGATAAGYYSKMGEKGSKLPFPSSEQSLAVSSAFVGKMIASGEKLSTFAVTQIADIKSCASAQDATCLQTIVSKYGQKLWRRPLLKAETDSLISISSSLVSQGASRTDALRATIESLLQSPAFWYRSELGSSAGAPAGKVKLSDYEVASFLSYTIWDGPPDDALLASAAAGTLATPDGVQKALERMLKDPKTGRGLSGFFDEWTGFSGVENVAKSTDLATFLDPATRSALKSETEQFIQEFGFAQNLPVKDFFSSNETFLNKASAQFYGMPTAVSGNGFEKVTLAPEKRAGIFTHASFLAAQSAPGTTALTHRGNFCS